VGILPNQQIEDAEVSNYKLESPKDSSMKRASWLKSILENSYTVKILLLLVTMLGTSMVIGDGILTPCISG
jgi:KUP system potassium uptake protein